MSKFQEIRSRYVALSKAEDMYWERLDRARKDIRAGLGRFLDVDENSPSGGDKSLPTIHFGGAATTFTGQSSEGIRREENELVFTLKIVLAKEERTFPPNILKFRCRLKYVANQFFFSIQEFSTTYIQTESDFNPIYEHLHAAILKKLESFNRP